MLTDVSNLASWAQHNYYPRNHNDSAKHINLSICQSEWALAPFLTV